jgi:hypothetical protein
LFFSRVFCFSRGFFSSQLWIIIISLVYQIWSQNCLSATEFSLVCSISGLYFSC